MAVMLLASPSCTLGVLSWPALYPECLGCTQCTQPKS